MKREELNLKLPRELILEMIDLEKLNFDLADLNMGEVVHVRVESESAAIALFDIYKKDYLVHGPTRNRENSEKYDLSFWLKYGGDIHNA